MEENELINSSPQAEELAKKLTEMVAKRCIGEKSLDVYHAIIIMTAGFFASIEATEADIDRFSPAAKRIVKKMKKE